MNAATTTLTRAETDESIDAANAAVEKVVESVHELLSGA